MIVSVKFRKNGEFTGREYSYQTNLPLNPGDIVMAPVSGDMKTVRVERVNVSPDEIPPAWRGSLREILEYAEVVDG